MKSETDKAMVAKERRFAKPTAIGCALVAGVVLAVIFAWLLGFFTWLGVVQIRVTPKTRNPFTIKALSISGVTWNWHVLNESGERWPASSEQRFALDKWSLCRLPS